MDTSDLLLMLLPHFSLRQFGQRFLSFPLLPTLINSAAPVSLYSCERAGGARRAGEVVKMHELDPIHSFLSGAGAGGEGQEPHTWALVGSSGGSWWGCLWKPQDQCQLLLGDVVGTTAWLDLWQSVCCLWVQEAREFYLCLQRQPLSLSLSLLVCFETRFHISQISLTH